MLPYSFIFLMKNMKTFRQRFHNLCAYVMLSGKILYLTKKSNNILQLQTTIYFKTKHIQSELCNKLFNASHVLLLSEKYNSIETLIYLHFLMKYTKMRISKQHFSCLYRSKFVYDFINVTCLCFVHFCTHQSQITQPALSYYWSLRPGDI